MEEEKELEPQQIIGEEQVKEAAETLRKYKSAKANLEKRIKEDELWWELRHWEAIGPKVKEGEKPKDNPKPTSAYLQNSLVNKHADIMDNYPEPICLPREESDEESARILSSVLPVILEYNDFEKTYRLNSWEKLKHGTAIYGVFWNSKKDDVEISQVDLMKVFWEPGITDIQNSRNVFILDMVDTDLLDEMYPEHAGKFKSGNIEITEYNYDDDVDTSEKSVVVDWYYKVTNEMSKEVLHYCKFCNNVVLYASQNDPELMELGFYNHSKYPLVFDTLFPEKGTPCGYGYVAVEKDPQMYIDQLQANILKSAMMATRKRFFVSESTGINEEEFADWENEIIHVQGEIGDQRIQEMKINPISGIYANILQMKIEELKDTGSNRDVNSGRAAGVTAASAIAALQEAGNKTSRSMISASYNAYRDICLIVIELIRQFYDVTRGFRITEPNGTDYSFLEINNSQLMEQVTGVSMSGELLYRKPIFDIKVKAQKRNPFSTMEANQRAQELYSMGFFQPERAQESMIALNMMEFEGIDKVKKAVSEGQTLYNMVQQLMGTLQQLTGIPSPMGGGMPQAPAPEGSGGGDTIQATAKQAQTPMTSYGQRLAARSTPNINSGPIGDTGAK